MVRPWEVISFFPSSYLTQSRPILFCLKPPVSSRLVWGYSTLPFFISFCLFYIYMLPWASSLLSCYFYLYFLVLSHQTLLSLSSLYRSEPIRPYSVYYHLYCMILGRGYPAHLFIYSQVCLRLGMILALIVFS
jgi:hypothetical protein